MKILLSGTRAPVTRDLVRAFAACSHEVHGADSLATASTARELNSFTRLAPPAQNFAGFARDAQALVARLKPDLIVPLCEDIFWWAKAAQGWPLFAPDLKSLMQLHSKFDFVVLADCLGLPVPETRRLGPADRATPGDWVYKPEFSRFGRRVVIRPQQAPPLAHDPKNPWLQQAWIAGEDVCFHAVAHGGRLGAFAAYRSSWRTKGGASYYFDPVETELSRALEAMAVRLAASLNLTAQLACDLRRDKDGRLWLIECNPRATSGLHLMAHDPAALSAAFTGGGDATLRSDGQAACVGPAMWFYGLRTNRLASWRMDIGRARDVFRGVAGAAVSDTLGFSVRAALAGQDLQDFLTADMACDRDLTCS
ncbi:ATP-grasp domain protein [Asticcacaulis biprosthecium C19]|uniref:ATP-grasp domain protein n=1 Tax=Asticcacaulis biprosthecium C19 TaxID=715226 RepID=F4QHZ0_9CAUL|nr:ATP-grasp domain-containing protein [Asticcacaulis biprosthecium]EGF91701.1 ATP-grasp domain protein [Asticcacaulis biprosthecium C19]